MSRLGVIVLVAVVMAWPAALEGQGPPGQNRRADLEQQVHRQFLRQVAQRADLSEEQHERVGAALQEGVRARRDLARQSRDLRHDLMTAVRGEDTPMSTYEGILRRLEAIRERERALELREEERLAAILDPRQRAIFLMMRMQFNDRIRRMQGGPGGSDGSGRGGPVG